MLEIGIEKSYKKPSVVLLITDKADQIVEFCQLQSCKTNLRIVADLEDLGEYLARELEHLERRMLAFPGLK